MRDADTTWSAEDAGWQGEFRGTDFGSDVSIVFTRLDRPGGGPGLHRHPYTETFIVRRGSVLFSDGTTSFEANAGDIVVVPPGRPHRFSAKSDAVEMIDIHASSRFVTEWLSEPLARAVAPAS